MLKKYLSLVIVAIVALSSLALAQTSKVDKNGFLSRFVGTWKGEGKITGLDARIVMSWENVLDGKFIRLSFRNEMRKKDGGMQVFDAYAYYKAIDEQKY